MPRIHRPEAESSEKLAALGANSKPTMGWGGKDSKITDLLRTRGQPGWGVGVRTVPEAQESIKES